MVSPGLVETEASGDRPQQLRDRIAASTPLGRIAAAEDAAKAIAMYVSDDSQFITGAYVPVNGGRNMD